jgi:hypothetical protein
VESNFSIQTPAPSFAWLGDRDAIRQRAARSPSPIIDRAEDSDVASGLVIPDGLNLDLIVRTGTPSDLDVVLAVDQGSQFIVAATTPFDEVPQQEPFGFNPTHDLMSFSSHCVPDHPT